MEPTSTVASRQDEAVVSAAQELYVRSKGGRVLLVVRLRTAYACSAFWYDTFHWTNHCLFKNIATSCTVSS